MSENKMKPESTVATIALTVCAAAVVLIMFGGANLWTALAAAAMSAMGGTMSYFLLRPRG